MEQGAGDRVGHREAGGERVASVGARGESGVDRCAARDDAAEAQASALDEELVGLRSGNERVPVPGQYTSSHRDTAKGAPFYRLRDAPGLWREDWLRPD